MSNRTSHKEIILAGHDLITLIESGNVSFQHPVHLLDGVYEVKTYQKLWEYATKNSDTDFMEYFTYWDLENNKPLFDIIVYKELFDDEVYFLLSNSSLFGMFWLKEGNRLSTGMKNMIKAAKLNVPDVDLLKYTENNFKKAILNKDFV